MPHVITDPHIIDIYHNDPDILTIYQQLRAPLLASGVSCCLIICVVLEVLLPKIAFFCGTAGSQTGGTSYGGADA
jgi:hypothetical protein